MASVKKPHTRSPDSPLLNPLGNPPQGNKGKNSSENDNNTSRQRTPTPTESVSTILPDSHLNFQLQAMDTNGQASKSPVDLRSIHYEKNVSFESEDENSQDISNKNKCP